MHSKCVEMHSNANFIKPGFPKEGHICGFWSTLRSLIDGSQIAVWPSLLQLLSLLFLAWVSSQPHYMLEELQQLYTNDSSKGQKQASYSPQNH